MKRPVRRLWACLMQKYMRSVSCCVAGVKGQYSYLARQAFHAFRTIFGATPTSSEAQPAGGFL